MMTKNGTLQGKDDILRKKENDKMFSVRLSVSIRKF